MKQTAVEWLQEALILTYQQEMQFEGLFQQAKEMEEQQIIEAYDLGSFSGQQYPNPKTIIKNGKEYYNKAFKKKI
jgi:hypothetical protein